MLGVLDVFTHEVLAIDVDTSLPSLRVVRVLERIIAERRAVPQEILLDNGPELTSRVLDYWAYERRVQLWFIDPRKPIRSAFIESFNGRLRDECLNQHWFLNLTDARFTIEAWRQDYYRHPPHSSLTYQTPKVFYRDAVQRPEISVQIAGSSK